MISNERPSPYASRPFTPRPWRTEAPRSHVEEDTLKSVELQVERKLFMLTLKENPRGRFLRISEEVAGRRNTIIIPAPGLEEFGRLVAGMAKAAAEIPAK